MDDLLIFSRTFEEHLRLVIERLKQAGLKLNHSKCHFICPLVKYLGHLITPDGTLPNPERVAAVKDDPTPCCVKDVRQFVGFASYYIGRIAQPLHALTQKAAQFVWTESCHILKNCSYSTSADLSQFDRSFVRETDASVKLGFGSRAVLASG